MSSIEDAIVSNVPLCTLVPVKPELDVLYPNANWVYLPSVDAMFEAFDKRLCHAIVAGFVNIRGNLLQQVGWCDRNLVRVGAIVLEKPVGAPINKELAAGFSHVISKAASEGITFDSFMNSQPLLCELEYIEDGRTGSTNKLLKQLTLGNMTMPLLLFGVCCVLAIAYRFVSGWRAAHGGTDRKQDRGKLHPDATNATVALPVARQSSTSPMDGDDYDKCSYADLSLYGNSEQL